MSKNTVIVERNGKVLIGEIQADQASFNTCETTYRVGEKAIEDLRQTGGDLAITFFLDNGESALARMLTDETLCPS